MPAKDRQIVPEFHRAIFLSDLHLGALGCRVEAILDFLNRNDAETIYLVGDIFDVWDPLIVHWSERHDQIVEIIRSRADHGAKLVYLVGNHDRAMVRVSPDALPAQIRLPVEPQAQVVHHAADGMRYLVLHGDVCDGRLLRSHICTRIGSRIDTVLRLSDRAIGAMRLRFSREARGPFELAMAALNSILYRSLRHERRLVALAGAAGCDGIICGHFHLAALHDDHRRRYANCGDWTDNCTAIIENWDGSLRLASAEAAHHAVIAESLPQIALPTAMGAH